MPKYIEEFRLVIDNSTKTHVPGCIVVHYESTTNTVTIRMCKKRYIMSWGDGWGVDTIRDRDLDTLMNSVTKNIRYRACMEGR